MAQAEPERPTDTQILAAAASHSYLVRREHLTAIGTTRAQLRRLTRPGGMLVPITPRVLAVGVGTDHMTNDRLLEVALLHFGPEAAVTGTTAHGLWVGNDPNDPAPPFSLVRQHGFGAETDLDFATLRASRSLHTADVVIIAGVRRTSPQRTADAGAGADGENQDPPAVATGAVDCFPPPEGVTVAQDGDKQPGGRPQVVGDRSARPLGDGGGGRPDGAGTDIDDPGRRDRHAPGPGHHRGHQFGHGSQDGG